MKFRDMSSWWTRAAVCAVLVMLIVSATRGVVASPGAAPIGMNEATVEGPASPSAIYTDPTTSSPIALSNDKAWVWSVNPDDDSVSVINASTDTLVFRLSVGDEPQSIALDPDGEYAYVASAADNSVTVIRVTNTSPFAAVVEERFVTGAEPWNIVISPDGKRVFVANSGQDTITVIKADVNYPTLPSILGNVTLDDTACNVVDTNRHWQPRGLAVTSDNTKLYVTRFLSFVKLGSTQGLNIGKEGIVCRLDINTSAATVGVTAFTPITLASQNSGFNGEQAYPNQMQSVVIRGDKAYLPNIASAPAAPLRFNADTHAFVNIINGAASASQSDGGAINLHLGARVPEAGKVKLFFANPWAMAFSNQSGSGNAYIVSAASDLVVKINVDASGALTFTNGVSTTRYIDLNDPNHPTTSARNAGKNPLGIVIRNIGPGNNKAYVMSYVSRNVSVINLDTDAVSAVLNLTNLPVPGTSDEQLQVGKEIFFSSRGRFDGTITTTVPITNRLSSDGWQSCSSCHFAGLTDGNVWTFGAGPRKSIPLNATFNPHDPDDQRILNYSAIFDEVQDFEINIRNVSGPGPLSAGPPPVLDPNHGLLVGDTGDVNTAPAIVNAFTQANAGRPQHKVTLPGSSMAWPALDALVEWVRFGVRTPNGMLTTDELTAGGGSVSGGLIPIDVALGRRLFFQAGCHLCHGGTHWTLSRKDFTSPPASGEIVTENPPVTTTVNAQYLPRFLSNINSFNLNVTGAGNQITGTPSIGAIEKAADGKDALGKDYNGDGQGAGFNIPSLLGIWSVPPYYHNGACETLDCVLADVHHRTANGTRPDRLSSPADRARVVEFLKSLDAATVFPMNLLINAHDIFFDPPTVFSGTHVIVGANVSLFGAVADLDEISNTLKVRFTGSNLDAEVPLPAFTQNFGQATVTTTWNVPSQLGIARVFVTVDSTNVLAETNESDNAASRLVLIRTPPPDTTPPTVNKTRISDDTLFDENDPIASTQNVKVRLVATDPSSPPTLTGLGSYCIVRYFYNVVLRRWVESTCTFQLLPAPDASSGNTFTYTVNTVLNPFEGAQYAFVWVRDKAGNISRTPGFDVISFIPASNININRNDVRLFRIQTVPGQTITMTFPIVFGDVDVSVFNNVTSNANRVALSSNNGAFTETVTFSNTFGALRVFQVEVRAVVNTRFRITYQASQVSLANLAGLENLLDPAGLPSGPATLMKDLLPTQPFIAGPPALQTAIGEPEMVYLPIVVRSP